MSGPAAALWSVYVVECADGSLYTGVTRDLVRRLAEHNGGIGSRYTRSRRPVSLRYAEPAASRARAQAREYRIKRMDRAAKLALIQAGGTPVLTPAPGAPDRSAD